MRDIHNRRVGCFSADLTGSECGQCEIHRCRLAPEVFKGVTYERAIAEFGVPADMLKPGCTYTIERARPGSRIEGFDHNITNEPPQAGR